MSNKIKYGVGVFEKGKYSARTRMMDGTIKTNNYYSIWLSMLSRCYNTPQDSVRFKKYIDCEVCKEWHYFQNFAEWYVNNSIDGYQMDKDILVRGNKIYSPETCCFVPQEINNLIEIRDQDRGQYMIGVNRDKRRPNSKFSARCSLLINGKRVYKALGTYETEIDAFNAYKKHKEENIRYVADEYYEKHLITKEVRDALYRFTINEND